jgi:drug/metabolite transporter (DMT)-like permease
MHPHSPTARLPDYALLVVLASVWGASYTFIKIGIETIPPVTLIAARTLIAGSLLLVVMRWRGVALPLERRLLGLFAFPALLNSVLPLTLLAWAEKSVDASLAVILNAMTPIFTFLITWRVTRHEPASFLKLLGVALGLLGTCLIIGFSALGGLGVAVLAQGAVLLATVFYAVAAVFGRHFKGLDPVVPATGSLLSGAVILIPASLFVDRPWTLAPSAASLAALLGLSILSTALAFTIYFRLLKTLGSVGVTAQAYLRVPIGVFIGMLALGETLAPTSLLGMICAVAGVAAMTVPGKALRMRLNWRAGRVRAGA